MACTDCAFWQDATDTSTTPASRQQYTRQPTCTFFIESSTYKVVVASCRHMSVVSSVEWGRALCAELGEKSHAKSLRVLVTRVEAAKQFLILLRGEQRARLLDRIGVIVVPVAVARSITHANGETEQTAPRATRWVRHGCVYRQEREPIPARRTETCRSRSSKYSILLHTLLHSL